MKIGSDYDPDWIEHQFQTQIVTFCNTKPESENLDSVEKAFFNCLEEGMAPRATLEMLKCKCKELLKTQVEQRQPTKAVRTCINYLEFQLEKMDRPVQHQFAHRLFVKGSPADLEKIADGIKVTADSGCQLVKHYDPPEKLTNDQMNRMLRGEVLRFYDVTKLEFLFDFDPETLKKFILQKFPNVTFL